MKINGLVAMSFVLVTGVLGGCQAAEPDDEVTGESQAALGSEASRCKKIKGDIVDQAVVTCPDSSGSGFCLAGTMKGSLKGSYLFAEDSTIAPTFYIGRDILKTPDGTLMFEEHGTFDGRTSGLANVKPGSTGRFANATGHIFWTGDLNTQSYSGELCGI